MVTETLGDKNKMSNLTQILEGIGQDNTILLTRNDKWVESQRQRLSSMMNELADDLRIILLVQKAKKILQHNNMVATTNISGDHNVTDDISVSIGKLHEVQFSEGPLGSVNRIAQIKTLDEDGYDTSYTI